MKEEIFISQKKYTRSILQKFKMMNCRSMVIPLAANKKFRKDDGQKKTNSSLFRCFIESLLYLTSTRPDIMFAASLLLRFMQEPNQVHFGAAKSVLYATCNEQCIMKNVQIWWRFVSRLESRPQTRSASLTSQRSQTSLLTSFLLYIG